MSSSDHSGDSEHHHGGDDGDGDGALVRGVPQPTFARPRRQEQQQAAVEEETLTTLESASEVDRLQGDVDEAWGAVEALAGHVMRQQASVDEMSLRVQEKTELCEQGEAEAVLLDQRAGEDERGARELAKVVCELEGRVKALEKRLESLGTSGCPLVPEKLC
eukprot:m51a1_g8794 hypothetical protein (162) ;mRNA; r:238384-238869